jgi:hypothetical protein
MVDKTLFRRPEGRQGMELKAGSKLKSAVCDTSLIVVRAPGKPVDLRCGGRPMLGANEEPEEGISIDPVFSGGTQIGKRYAAEELGLEVLCTKGGEGSLSIGEDLLEIKAAKPLPASD